MSMSFPPPPAPILISHARHGSHSTTLSPTTPTFNSSTTPTVRFATLPRPQSHNRLRAESDCPPPYHNNDEIISIISPGSSPSTKLERVISLPAFSPSSSSTNVSTNEKKRYKRFLNPLSLPKFNNNNKDDEDSNFLQMDSSPSPRFSNLSTSPLSPTFSEKRSNYPPVAQSRPVMRPHSASGAPMPVRLRRSIGGQEDVSFVEWGKDEGADDEDDGSGMAWLKKRRAEREKEKEKEKKREKEEVKVEEDEQNGQLEEENALGIRMM